ncbi:hypothetical protein AAMO2058_000852700 [Amorphochlora amoebiformis]
MIWVSLLLLSPPPPALATPAAQTSRFSRYSLPSLPLVRRPKSELAIRSSAGTLHPQAWSTGCGGLRRGVMRGAASGGGRRFVAPTGQEGQTISAGDNIVVMGALDQVGRTIIGRLQKEGDFKISTLLSPNVLGMFKSKYPTIEAISASDEQEAKATLQKASVVIMAFEKPADTDTLRYLLGFGAEGEAKLKRFVLLSKTGVTRKNNIGMAFFKNVIGGELNKYFDLEDLLLKGADALKVDYTIVRSGKLRLGPDDFVTLTLALTLT